MATDLKTKKLTFGQVHPDFSSDIYPNNGIYALASEICEALGVEPDHLAKRDDENHIIYDNADVIYELITNYLYNKFLNA